MAAASNVTTPGGFFIGIGGILSFCIVSAVVFWWVKSPSGSEEFRAQQVVLGLRPGPAATGAEVNDKNKKTEDLLREAALRYNGGAEPDLDKLDDLRGVIRYRESEKSKADAAKALNAPPAWKDKAKGEVTMPIDRAMQVVASGLKDRKPKASAVKVDIFPAADPSAPPIMPNLVGGGAKTVIFADPNAKPPAPAAPATAPAPAPAPSSAPAPAAAPVPAPAAPAVPAAPPTPAPAKPSKPTPAPGAAAIANPATQTVSNVPAPNRPPLLNWPEPKK